MGQKRSKRPTRLTPSPSPSASSSSFDLASPDRPFDNILNFRDVGRSINEFSGDKILKEGILFRSARLDDASERDRHRLIDDINLSTIIDLRSNTEHELATRRRQNSISLHSSEDSRISQTGERRHLLDLLGVQRHFISLTGRAFERLLLWRLDWYNFIKVLSLLASGYRKDAIKLIAAQVMKPCGLIGLAQDTLDSSRSEIRDIFSVLTKDGSYPILIHCTQGKDRTGLIIMLLLLLVSEATTPSIPLTAIASDYTKSEAELRPDLDSLMKEITDIGLDEEFAKTPSGFTEAIKSYLDMKYGGARGYLLSIGCEEGNIEKVRKRLLFN
ncbi:tyrosine/serine protein phosphatase, putative [Talaromyces stipitatus ATCC 10500]|uniref:Tyrosine/serine protein phosphatase, putative n=1 Tax=Talaromyces stipitatus (strain ATCC 10500 / CBS 375.48 / QM 6759 / NRRL 1006) TaxID=441959 RepID=B8MKF7_TALSN|nr:tyrosine/serine protein phosphatase, putative [Talaromyces stipitatus ATCC 10500]EED15312.1 tyrosine/serine protein phosphatase, putative [Talaromyces stipitatus ATCC 10500]